MLQAVAVVFLILLFLFLLILFMVAPATSTAEQRAPILHRNYAHRGLHRKDKSVPENSMAAFAAAVEAGYGIELDIQFSKDEQLVVFHDDELSRVCGVSARVDELTFDELQALSLCNTAERIPLFSEVLSLVNGTVPLIVELKAGPKNKQLCTAALAMLRAYNGPFCVESFHPLIVGWFRKHAPDLLRGQLSASAAEFRGKLSAPAAFCLSHVLSNFYARPHFIAYHKKKRSPLVKLSEALGAVPVVWTVRDTDSAVLYEAKNNIVIFEFYRPDLFLLSPPNQQRH